MRISLNLATRPYADLRPALKRLRIAMAVLILLGGGLLLGLRAVHQKAEEARATLQSVQSKIDAVNRERQGYQEMMRQPANAALLTQAAALNQIFDVKTFSWTLAMEDLETVLPGGVQVTTLEPVRDAKDGHITLKLRVVGPRDRADDLVQNLEHSKHFLLPHIVSESSETTGGANERLEPVSASNRFSFELLADYNPAAPVERKGEKNPGEKKPGEKKPGEKKSGQEKPAAKGDKSTAPRAQTQMKPMAAGGRAVQIAPPPHAIPPVLPPPAPARQPGRQIYTGPFQPRPNANPNPNHPINPNPGGPQ